MSEMIKFAADRSWVFDVEFVPCIPTIRRVYGLPVSMTDGEALEFAYTQANGYDAETNNEPMLKALFYRVVSLSCVTRTVTNGKPALNLLSLPDKEFPDATEAEILGRFLQGVGKQKPQLVGFASQFYDLAVMMQRAMVNGVAIPDFCQRPDKPWEGVDYFARSDWNVDLMKVIGGWSPTTNPKLSEICPALRIPGKLGVDGSQVAEMWFAGERQAIIDYNETDACSQYLLWLEVLKLSGWVSAEQYTYEKGLFRQLLLNRNLEGAEHLGAFIDEWDRLQNDVPAENPIPISEPDAPAMKLAETGTVIAAVTSGDSIEATYEHTVSDDSVKELTREVEPPTCVTCLEVEVAEPFSECGNCKAIRDAIAEEEKKTEFEETLKKTRKSQPKEPETDEVPQFPADPIAKRISEFVTTKQLGMIRAICRENSWNEDEECIAVMKCKVRELNCRAASAFIDHLLAKSGPPEAGKFVRK